MKQGENLKITANILKPIIDYYRKDKVRLIKYLVYDLKVSRVDIAKILEVDPSSITHLLKREAKND